jgi:Transglycosylase SLT domain
MEKLTRQVWLCRLLTPRASRGYRWREGVLLSLVMLLLAVTGGWPREPGAAGLAREAGIDIPAIGAGELQQPQGVYDPVYDHFLQRFRPLRADVSRRRYLAAEVMTAAIQYRVDPDLLFALVAVESSFNSAAVSRKGARGLGQIMFATGRTVAPGIVRTPEDLKSVPRNLQFTALYLRRLLMEENGELSAALTAYHTGSASGRLSGPEVKGYVDRICREFASLKTERAYRRLMAMAPGQIED